MTEATNTIEAKACSQCGEVKPLGRRHRHGLEPEDFAAMVEAQGGRCAICPRPVEKLKVDHDHTTGQIRGLLCDLCNRGLGMFADSPDNLLAAAIYLIRHGGGDAP